MIRYVHVGDAVNDGDDEFAFYDTVTDRFLTFDGRQLFGAADLGGLPERWRSLIPASVSTASCPHCNAPLVEYSHARKAYACGTYQTNRYGQANEDVRGERCRANGWPG